MEFWKRYWKVISSFKNVIAVALTWMLFTELLMMVRPYMMKVVFDLIELMGKPESAGSWVSQMTREHLGQDLTAVLTAMGIAALALALIELSSALVGYGSRKSWIEVSLGMDRKIEKLTFNKLLFLSMGYHIQENTGEKTGKVSRGVSTLGHTTYTIFRAIVPSLIEIPLLVIMASLFDYRIGLVMVVMVPVHVYFLRRLDKKLEAPKKRRHDLYEKADNHAMEALSNIQTVQAFGQEDREAQELYRIRAEGQVAEREEHMAHFRQGIYYQMDYTLAFLIIIGLCVLGIYEHRITVGTAVMMMGLVRNMLGSVSNLTHNLRQISMDTESMVRLFDLIDRESEIKMPENPMPMDQMHGAVTFENVSFSYGSGQDALRKVSFEAAPGEMVAFVGPSGAGKSTIINLLLRAFDVFSGRILIDGKDLREIDLKGFRSQIGVVKQQVEVFSKTIAENISYGYPEASWAEIIHAAKLANAHEFIVNLPDGYLSRVGEKGVNLSGGQVQRLGIARAILRNPKLLIFDEATSNLDPVSERYIQEALDKISQDRTTIVIAHRLSTIYKADKIVVLKEGAKIEEGDHAALLRQNGLYHKLVDLQSADLLRA